MAFKIKTSKKTEEILARLESSHNLPCYTLVKLAIALSLRDSRPLEEKNFKTNALGRELNRQTITGEADVLYKCLMELYAQKHLTDDEFFPLHTKAHIDRGAVLLEQEARYGGDLLIHLTELEKSI